MLPHYVTQIEGGYIDVDADGEVISESGCCLVYDARLGFGQITARICSDHAARLARQHGIGMVVARDCNHFGAAGFWAGRISQNGFLGICMCDSSPQVPPWQGKQPRVGTNPLSVAVPHPNGRGWLLDMATAAVALGKLEQLRLKGESEVPYGWALDSDGSPTTDIASARWLMPLGGYKGSGLAMMVEILTGVLAGGKFFGPEVAGLRDRTRPMHANHTFIAIDIARFLPIEDFHARMEWLVEQVKSAAPARGYDEVLVAGDPELQAEEERTKAGIPIHEGIWRTVVDAATRVGVSIPQPV
jgi:LDH2 family malate/lactate/ureidoglycolate dehydrogenase